MTPINDLEIYLVKANPEQVKNWLIQHFGQPASTLEQKNTIEWVFACQQGDMPVLWTGNVEKNIASLWFKANLTDWQDDMQCAQSAHQALDVEVRCNQQGWQENGDDVEQPWVKWINGQSKTFHW